MSKMVKVQLQKPSGASMKLAQVPSAAEEAHPSSSRRRVSIRCSEETESDLYSQKPRPRQRDVQRFVWARKQKDQ